MDTIEYKAENHDDDIFAYWDTCRLNATGKREDKMYIKERVKSRTVDHYNNGRAD